MMDFHNADIFHKKNSMLQNDLTKDFCKNSACVTVQCVYLSIVPTSKQT